MGECTRYPTHPDRSSSRSGSEFGTKVDRNAENAQKGIGRQPEASDPGGAYNNSLLGINYPLLGNN